MAVTDEPAQGTLETRKDAGTGSAAEVKFWLESIKLSEEEEADWLKLADEAYGLYSAGAKSKGEKRKSSTFNILYSNVETIVPAVYNSTPVPDIRPRDLRTGNPQYKDDPSVLIAKDVASVVERTLTVFLDQYDFDHIVESAVRDQQIGGRGISRVRYEPKVVDGNVAYQSVYCEKVLWSEVRRGPGRSWPDTPWWAFRHYMTRDQLVALSETNGPRVKLEESVKTNEDKNALRGPEAEVFKRALVWEIWDKEKRQVVFVSPSFPEAPVAKLDDMLKLRDFFPFPRPLMDVNRPDDLTPVCPYTLYREQALELDEISKRIRKITKAIRARGIYDASLRTAMKSMADMDDGDLAASDQAIGTVAQGGALDKAIWFMPVEALANVLAQLVAQREAIKQTIYEIIGISDILRGQVDPREKAAQSNLKAQWGASRLHTRQKEASRYARDLIRLMAEIVANHFEPQVLSVIAAMPVGPEHIQIMRNDALMSFRVDIETDSTIQADTQRTQQNVGQFVQGFGTFMQALAPAVEAGVMPMDVAADMLKSFARVFKLGRQAEDALDRLGQQAQQQQGQQQPDPEAMKAQAEIARKDQEAQLKAQVEQQKLQLAQQKAASDQQIAQLKMQLEREKATMQAAGKQQELAMQAEAHQQGLAMDAQAQAQDMALRQQQTEQEMAMSAERSQRELSMAEEQARQGQQIKARESEASIAAKRAASRKPKGTTGK